mgnify:CR=1 FL=1
MIVVKRQDLSFNELVQIKEAAKLVGFLPDLQAYVDKMERALDNRIFTALDDKTLTPEQALYAWMEKKTYRQLLKRVEQQVKIGVTVGERRSMELQPLPI